MLCEVLSKVLDRIKPYLCRVFLYLKQHLPYLVLLQKHIVELNGGITSESVPLFKVFVLISSSVLQKVIGVYNDIIAKLKGCYFFKLYCSFFFWLDMQLLQCSKCLFL